jgi:hypothetical protein
VTVPIVDTTVEGAIMTDPNAGTNPEVRDGNNDQPVELKEYAYYVGQAKMTAQLTPEMAEQLGAVEVGQGEPQKPGEGDGTNREAQRLSTQTQTAEERGVAGAEEGMNKARQTRNRRAQ